MTSLPPLVDTSTLQPGWKIHLNVPDGPEKPGFMQETVPVITLCRDHKRAYKVGTGGLEEEGKGMTIYIGDRRAMQAFADLLVCEGLDGRPSIGDTLVDDQDITGNVRARYDVRAGNGWDSILTRVGWQGISYLRNEVLFYDPISKSGIGARALFSGYENGGDLKGPYSRAELIKTAHAALVGLHGDHYYGDGHGPAIDPHALLKLRRSVPVGYAAKRGKIPGLNTLSKDDLLCGLKSLTNDMVLFQSGKDLLAGKTPASVSTQSLTL